MPAMSPKHENRDESARQAVHVFHHSFRGGGGKERYAIALVTAFRELGEEVVFHTMRADVPLAEKLGVRLNLMRPTGIPRKLQDFWFFRRISRVHANGPQITLSRVRAQDLLISGGTHRGYLDRAKKISGPFDWLQVWMERQSYAAPRRIIAHSDLLERDLQYYYGVPRAKIVTLYPPVDQRFHQPHSTINSQELRKMFRWPEDKVVFLFPSSGHSRKGLNPIRAAMASFANDVVLAVAGKPPTGAKEPFVGFLGYIENLPDAYRAADFTILGSNYEPFGLVGPESIMCGTRLVFEKDIGCLHAIKPENVFTFSVWDQGSIQEAISKALTLAREKRHKIPAGPAGLTYNPDPLAHARDVLRLVRNHNPERTTSTSSP